MQQHLSEETPQQRADRLLAADQNRRAGVPAPIAPSRWQRVERALRPWFAGFHNPYVDAIGIAFLFYFTALLTVFAAMQWQDRAPPASDAFSVTMEATSRPAAVSPLGGGANGGSF